MLLCRQHLSLLRMVGVSRAARTAGLASSARPPAGAPAEVVPADASPLAGVACASLPCPLTSPHVARFLAICRTSTRAGALSSLVPLAVIGRDLGLQRTPEPVNPGLDLCSRVAILVREHRTQ